jgi:hypothetical protein
MVHRARDSLGIPAAPARAWRRRGRDRGRSVPLTAALSQLWQFGVLAAAALALLPLRRGIVQTLLLAGLAGLLASLLSASVPR